ncbi:hypothetical protein [Frankia sp. Cj3]|uniref:vWA domain-containing protein n=1 Tax=Frankia sp. Cj3 TaxID=2880976 RepID=UPI001EF7172A|nr:hypothetical protein [Frankia sp. Cj3]
MNAADSPTESAAGSTAKSDATSAAEGTADDEPTLAGADLRGWSRERRGPSPLARDVEPGDTSYRRRLVVVLLDASGSMGLPLPGPPAAPDARTRLDALRAELDHWQPVFRAKGGRELREVELAVIAFGGAGNQILTGGTAVEPDRLHEDGGAFVPAAELDIRNFEATGRTNLVEAIDYAVELAVRRTRYLAAEKHLQTGQIRMVMLTDGGPNDDGNRPREAWEKATERLCALRQRRLLTFFLVGVGVSESDDRMLSRLATGSFGSYTRLASFDFASMLEFVLIATTENPEQSARARYRDGNR